MISRSQIVKPESPDGGEPVQKHIKVKRLRRMSHGQMAIPCRLHAQSTPTSLGAHWEPHPHWLQLWGEVKRNYLFLSNLEFLKTYFFSFGGIGVWTRGFVLAKQILYTWAMSPLAICDLVIFETGPHIYAQAGLDCDLPTYVSCVAGMVHGHSYAQPLVGMEVWNFFSQAGFELFCPPNLYLPSC
jgi:hypothetical protein